MAKTDVPIKTIGYLIDDVEQVREELLALQQSLEEHETREASKMVQPAKVHVQDVGPSASLCGKTLPLSGKQTSEQLRRDAIELRKTAANLIEHAATLIERAVVLEERVSKLNRS